MVARKRLSANDLPTSWLKKIEVWLQQRMAKAFAQGQDVTRLLLQRVLIKSQHGLRRRRWLRQHEWQLYGYSHTRSMCSLKAVEALD